MVYTTKATREKWRNLYDDFGDSFTEDSSAADLRQSLDQAEAERSELPAYLDLKQELEQELRGYPYYLLRGIVLYIDIHMEDNERQLMGLRCELYGGTVADQLCERVTHVIVGAPPGGEQIKAAQDAAYRRERQARLKKGVPLFHMVSPGWVRESIAAAKILDEAEFEV
jgi:hypothetical protein